jgi:hypothetical protein
VSRSQASSAAGRLRLAAAAVRLGGHWLCCGCLCSAHNSAGRCRPRLDRHGLWLLVRWKLVRAVAARLEIIRKPVSACGHVGVGLWLSCRPAAQTRRSLNIPRETPPPKPVILSSRADPPARILSSRRSLRSLACSAALEGGVRGSEDVVVGISAMAGRDVLGERAPLQGTSLWPSLSSILKYKPSRTAEG